MTDEELDRAAEVKTKEELERAVEVNTKEELDRAVEVWKAGVDVQKHFNDIEMKIRNYALTLLLAVLAGAGVAIQDPETIHFLGWDLQLATMVLLAGLIAWIAFYFMDELWYHRFLVGAVKHTMDLEDDLTGKVPGIRLTNAIKDASPFGVGRFKLQSAGKIRIFYALIAAVLGFAVWAVEVGTS